MKKLNESVLSKRENQFFLFSYLVAFHNTDTVNFKRSFD